MEYKIELGAFNSVFAVPVSLADEYIKIATGDNLKVLLYCLRHSGQSLSAGEISRATGVAPDNVTSSFEFWEQRGLFGTAQSNHPANSLDVKKSLLNRDHEFTPIEISDIIKGNKVVEYLFRRGEELYGRPLKPNEQKALAVIIEDAGMKPEIALMLMEYCFSEGKIAPSYMKKVAGSWLEQGVN